MMLRKKRRLASDKPRKVNILFLLLPFIIGYFLVMKIVLSQKSPLINPLSSQIENKEKGQEENITVLLEREGYTVDSISQASNSAYLVRLQTGEELILEEKNYSKQISSLQQIFSQLTMEGKKVARLDLRFDKPVVVFK